MDRRPPPPLEESMRELTLEDDRRGPDPPSYRFPDEAMMDLDGGGGGGRAAETRRHQHGTVGVPQQYLGGNILPAVPSFAAPPPVGAAVLDAVGHHGHMEEARRGFPPPPPWQKNAPARVRGVEEILLEMLPEGSVLVGYTVNGYLFA